VPDKTQVMGAHALFNMPYNENLPEAKTKN
jgi:hypothetical protein